MKSFWKKICLTVILIVLIISSMTYGVMSARRGNWFYNLYLKIYNQKQLYRKNKWLATRKGTGIWHKSRKNAALFSEEQKSAIDELNALPYLKGYNKAPVANEIITIYDETRAFDGLNFVLTGNAPNAFLMDMDGNVLHTWYKQFDEVWPQPFEFENLPVARKEYWKRAKMLANGDLLAIFTDYGLIRLDRDSNLLWAYKARCHHDMFEAEDGKIYVLTREVKEAKDLRIASQSFEYPIWEDFITILSADGTELKKYSLLECFLNSEYAGLLENIKNAIDVLHTNTIRPISGFLTQTQQIFRPGQILTSMRDIHTIAVVDLEHEKVTWAFTGLWRFQHEPRLLKNGNIMVFDNRGHQGKSKVVEFNPLTQEVVWSYKGEPADAFYSKRAGTNERLPNGNTLITESEYGRAFEVTPSGEIVWEFYNPFRTGENKELIAALYDVVRVEPEKVQWLTQD